MTVHGSNLYRHPPEVVEEVLHLHDNGWRPMQIVRIMASRGTPVSCNTISRWVHPKRAQRDRERNRQYGAAKRAAVRAQQPEDPYKGLTGLSRKVAELEDRIAALEAAQRPRLEAA